MRRGRASSRVSVWVRRASEKSFTKGASKQFLEAKENVKYMDSEDLGERDEDDVSTARRGGWSADMLFPKRGVRNGSE